MSDFAKDTNVLISKQAAIDGKINIQLANGVEIYSAEAVLVDYLRALPTIDPVKHGKWIWQDSPVFGNPYGSYMCPLCQNTMPHKTNYCPHCGAKMDGGKRCTS